MAKLTLTRTVSATHQATAIARRVTIKRLVQILAFTIGLFLIKVFLLRLYSRYIIAEGNVSTRAIQKIRSNFMAFHDTDQDHPTSLTRHTENDTYNGPVEFVLYRYIGNDFPPRRAPGQSYNNLEFILKNEPELPGLEKRWILNRIFDATEKERIIRLLDTHKQHYEIIDLNSSTAEKIRHRLRLKIEEKNILERASTCNETLMERIQYRGDFIDYIHHDEILDAVQDENKVRNLALENGIKAGFKWILPWDGNLFLSKSAWIEMRDTVMAQSTYKYFYVPMDRLSDNKLLLDPSFCPLTDQEPQLIFRNDTKEKFNLNQRSGSNPEENLLIRLGVRGGPWEGGSRTYEETIKISLSSDVTGETGENGKIKGAGVLRTGWVAMLSSGSEDQVVSKKNNADLREVARCLGVEFLLDPVDQHAALRLNFLSKEALATYNETVMKAERDAYEQAPEANEALVKIIQQLVEYANESLTIPIPTEKTVLGPPIPVSPEVYDTPKEIIPPARLSPLFKNTTYLALGWFYTRRTEFATKAAMLIGSFFLEKDTRVSPEEVVDSMFYGEEEKNVKHNKQFVVGSIEMKDLYYFLDAVRLVAKSGVLNMKELSMIQLWFAKYSSLVLHRARGDVTGFQANKGEFKFQQFGQRGIYSDLQLSSVASFSGNSLLSMHLAEHARARMQITFAFRPQLRPNTKINEYIGTMRLDHRTSINDAPVAIVRQFNAWFLLAKVNQPTGIDLLSFQHDSPRPLLKTATLFYIPGFLSQYLIEMEAVELSIKRMAIRTIRAIQLLMNPEIREGLLLSYYTALHTWPDLIGQQDKTESHIKLYEASPLANEDLGLHPFWNLGLTDQYLYSSCE